jgi:proteasome assembly chaperone (PAC2) family protein
VAFAGWNDAADAATTALKFLSQRWQPTKIADIESEDFYVFSETRPVVRLNEDGERSLVWPTNRFVVHSDPDMPHDVLLFLGTEPNLKWQTFSSTFMEVLEQNKVTEVIFVGALLADVAHTLDVPITGSSTQPDLMERLHEMRLERSRYEGPTGIIGVLHDACRQADIPAASFWAAVPHYLAANPNLKVMYALLSKINAFLSLGLDLSELETDAEHFEQQIDRLVAKDPEASAYVRKLEQQAEEEEDEEEEGDEEDEIEIDLDRPVSSGPLPSADLLIRDVEELLRRQRENGQHLSPDEGED